MLDVLSMVGQNCDQELLPSQTFTKLATDDYPVTISSGNGVQAGSSISGTVHIVICLIE